MSFLVLLINFALISANDVCSNHNDPPKYHLIEKCHRSKLGIVAYDKFSSLTSCQRLGMEKKGLALNFSPPEAREDDNKNMYSCEVLRCAETEGGSSLVNDTRFDYYSLYARPIPIKNATCVPVTGMFHLLPELLNYTEAVRECKNLSGNLADIIITEQRTEALGQVLAEAGVDEAFVGMTRHNRSVFSKDNGNSLDCTPYRAWAPGHPRKTYNHNCMLITRHKTWKTTPCSSRAQALCELVPKGPFKRGSLFVRRNGTDVSADNNPLLSILLT